MIRMQRGMVVETGKCVYADINHANPSFAAVHLAATGSIRPAVAP